MSDKSQAEIIVDRLEGEMSHGYHTTADCSAFASLIADWRKRGAALSKFSSDMCEGWCSNSDHIFNDCQGCEARAALRSCS